MPQRMAITARSRRRLNVDRLCLFRPRRAAVSLAIIADESRILRSVIGFKRDENS